jgi:tetratricopeptide (TPR) repeat protein
MKTCSKSILAALVVLSGTYLASGDSQPRPVNHDVVALQKYRIEKALGQEVISWLCDANDAAAVECDRLADLLLSLEEADVRSYFIAAQVAWLREKPQKAISVLEDVISKYPDEAAPYMTLPVRIVARFWIGIIARRSRDTTKAKNVYEVLLTILESPENIEGIEDKGGLMMICNLYLVPLTNLCKPIKR